MLWKRWRRDEDGQIIPVMLTAVIAILAVTMLLLQVGRAGLLRTRTQTAADAAALAALKAVENDLLHHFRLTGSLLGQPPDKEEIRSAAAEYADRNGGEVTDIDFEFGWGTYAVSVSTRSEEAQGGDLETVDDEHATAHAAATLQRPGCLTLPPTDDGARLTTLSCGDSTFAWETGREPPEDAVTAIASGTEVRLVAEMPTNTIQYGPVGGFQGAAGARITRKEILSRAFTWYNDPGPPVPYSMSDYINRAQTGLYRTDCSGFVSMAWHLNTSLSTETLHTVSHPISPRQLKPGDILLWPNDAGVGHVILFVKWIDKSAGTYLAIEQTPPETTLQPRTLGGPYVPYRYDNIDTTGKSEKA